MQEVQVKVPRPPNNSPKGDPPPLNVTRDNLSKPEPDRTVALNFRVSAEFKKNFKIAAATRGISQSQLLQESFKEWQANHG